MYCIRHQVYYRGHHIGCTAFANRCTAYTIMHIRGQTWVYCICQQVYSICHHVHQEPHLGVLPLPASVLHVPSCSLGASLGFTAFVIVYWISYHVHQRPHFGVLHLPSSALRRPSCTSGASSVLHVPSCTSGASPGCTTLAIKCTTEAHQVLHEAHLGVLYLTSSVLQRPSCSSGASLGCTAFGIKCAAVAIIFRSLTWVYCIFQQVHCILHQVYCTGHHELQELHRGVLH